MDMPFGPAPPPHECAPAILLWNAMGGTIDWSALPILSEVYGVADIEATVGHLIVIRDKMASRNTE
jgi:hypothetical protein